ARLAPAVYIPIKFHRDLVFDPVSSLLYVTTSKGTVERYDPATNQILTPWQVGTSLYGGDVTADGSALSLAESPLNASGQGVVHKVSLAGGTVTDLTYPPTVGEAGAWDVSIAAGGIGFVTSQYAGSGTVPLRQFYTSTDTLSVRNDAP